jgi:hypothetical protein
MKPYLANYFKDIEMKLIGFSKVWVFTQRGGSKPPKKSLFYENRALKAEMLPF